MSDIKNTLKGAFVTQLTTYTHITQSYFFFLLLLFTDFGVVPT